MDDEIPEFKEEAAPPPVQEQQPSEEEIETETVAVEGVDIKPELIELDKRKILPYVKPQQNKYWHFQLSEGGQKKLQHELETIPNYKLTATYGIPQNTADITLKQSEQIVGKIHFLLCDRRDANRPEKYYTKLFLFHFKDMNLLNAVRNRLLTFFNNLKAPQPPRNKQHSMKSLKRRNLSRGKRNNLRRKTNKRRVQ